MNAATRLQPALPLTLAGFKNRHAGETIVVCGCGPSLRDLVRPERFVTIGVNDVGRLFDPDYLVVLNSRGQFAADRFAAVERSRAKAVFSHLDLGVAHPHIVRFALGRIGGVDFGNPNVLNYTRNSPYLASCLAIHMGARRIGLIGVDFTNGHFFGGAGAHPLSRTLTQIDAEYRRLNDACARMGVELFNLSPQSRLTTVPKLSLGAFAAAAPRPLRLVSYATTPIAGVPLVLGRAIAQASPHAGRTVWASSSYGNGVEFGTDVEYPRQPTLAADLLEAADVVVVHNGKVDPRHRALLDAKPVITLAHNYMWNVDAGFVQRGFPGLVVAQYQATLPEFSGWTPVPNPIPLWEAEHAPGDPEAKRGDGRVAICFAPSGKHERFPVGHRLFWHAKGYRTTMAALDALQKSHGVRLEVIRGRQVSHREAMAMKQRAHIVIDECATGGYHRASLEGLAVGAVAVNGVGLLAGVPELLRHCADAGEPAPFVSSSLESLHEVVAGLIAQGPDRLAATGLENRAWMERNWSFARQWTRFWAPAVERALDAAAARRPPRPALAVVAPPPPQQPEAPSRPKPAVREVTAVVPFAGAARLPALAATLGSLRAQGLGGVVVVESDAEACAEAVAADAGARHVFAPWAEGFHKARAMNVGAGLAAGAFILWCDADLILPEGFVAAALDEMQARRLDYLVPWTSIGYLGEAETQAVLAGALDAFAAAPIRTVYSRHGERGALGLLRASLFRAQGGVCEQFVGWGGEDEAFFHKASLFGRAAATNRERQHVRHLYHLLAGALEPAAAAAANPRHAENMALAREIRRIGSRARFLERFAPPRHPPAPWTGVKRLGCAPGGEAALDALSAFYGPAVALCAPGERADALWWPRPGDDPAAAPPLADLLAFAASLTRTETPAMNATARPAPPADASPLRLNLGCGDASVPGFRNVDRFKTSNVDEIADLAQPWPWPDDSAAEIRAWDVIEHLPDKIHTMNEIWRVLRPGGRVEIVVPTTDGPGAFQDPTHVSFWHRRSFIYYEAGNPYRERFAASYGIKAAFQVVREQIAQSVDGPKLTIVLEAVKAPPSADAACAGDAAYDVVILSANAANLIACVGAVRGRHPGLDPSRIIVVDDGARREAEAALPGVRWVAGVKPFAFARNANIGLTASTRDVILLNDDALAATPGGFDKLARAAREGGGGAVSSAVSGLIGNPNQKPRPGGGLRAEPRQLCFVCVYLPRATLDAVGPFDDRFVGYGFEDNDYCDRIRVAGLTLSVFDGCVVDHSGRLPSTFRTRPDFGALSALNRRLYRLKQAGAAAEPAAAEVVGALRVKDEAEHIGEALESVLPLCRRVLVFDDHSQDETPAICERFGARVEVIRSPFSGLDEARDKNHLLSRLAALNPDWTLWIDGDEVMERGGAERLTPLLDDPQVAAYSLRIAYLWDDPGQVRTDGIFGRFTRPSLFRLRGQPLARLGFARTGAGNLHCGNVPRGLRGALRAAPVRLKHYGYLSPDQRQRKYDWYTRIDPDNRAEDFYRHLIGVPGARHAPGPPQFARWDE